MSRDQHWQLAITPLSPVHLGSGQDYEPTGYVIDDGALYEFDAIAALGALPAAERDKLGKTLNGPPSQAMLREVQAFFHANRERLIPVARRCVQVNPSIEAFYQERVGRIVQREQGGRDVQNRLEIERTAYNLVNGAPMLPGSGLKGAIRTALLDGENQGQSLPGQLRGDRSANLKLQQQLFDYRAGQFEHDPLRLIRLADAPPAIPDATATRVHFAVNRKKSEVMVGGQLVNSQAAQQGLYQLLECLVPLQPRAFVGQISIQETLGIESRHWPSLRFDLPTIAAACNTFYRPIFDDELDRLRQRRFADDGWVQAVQRLLTGPLAERLGTHRAFLLRVGRHSGAESVTLNGVRDIKIMKGRGERPEFLPYAKTFWLAAMEPGAQLGLLPFGWLLVEPYDAVTPLATLDLPNQAPETSAWQARVAARRQALSAQLAEAREREVQAHRERETAVREAAQREARRAALSPQERELDALRELLRRDQESGVKQAGGELAESLVKLLKTAAQTWPQPERSELADLAEQIYGYLGWPAAKKKRERQEQIQALRVD